MKPGFAIVMLSGPLYLNKRGAWSVDPSDAHVFETWAIAKSRSRAFRGSEVTEAWL